MERGHDESMSDLVRELQARRNHPTNVKKLKAARSRIDKSFRLERSDNLKSILKEPEVVKDATMVANPSWITRIFQSLSCTSIDPVDNQAHTSSAKNSKRISKELPIKSAKTQFHGSDSQIIIVQDDKNPVVDDESFHYAMLSKERKNMYESSAASMMSTKSYDTEQIESSFRLSGSFWTVDSSFSTTPPVSYYPSNKPWANEPRPMSG